MTQVAWVTEELRELYAEACGLGANEIILVTENSTRKFVEARQSLIQYQKGRKGDIDSSYCYHYIIFYYFLL